MQTTASQIGIMALVGGIIFMLSCTAALAMNRQLIGAVIKTDQGYALSTKSGEFLILGKRPANLEGKTVSVKGNVENGALASTISIRSYKVLSNKDTVDPAMRTPGSATH